MEVICCYIRISTTKYVVTRASIDLAAVYSSIRPRRTIMNQIVQQSDPRAQRPRRALSAVVDRRNAVTNSVGTVR